MTTQIHTFFKPHLWLKVERDVPRPIFIIALTGRERWLNITLPDAYSPEDIHQYFYQHYQKMEEIENQRAVTCYGTCLGYYYHYKPRNTIEYDVSGHEIARHHEFPPHYDANATLTTTDGDKVPFKIE